MTPRPAEKEGDDDDDWEDDFTDFQASPPPSSSAPPKVEEEKNDLGKSTSDDCVETKTTTAGGPPVVETVGDFTEFSQSEASRFVESVVEVASPPSQPPPAPEAAVAAAAPPPPTASTTSSNPWEKTVTTDNEAGNNATDPVAETQTDLPSTTTPPAEHNIASDDKEMELGETVETDAATRDTKHMERPKANEPEEDFGDFAATAVSPQTNVVEEYSDSFGDFGGAELVDNVLDDAVQATTAQDLASSETENPTQPTAVSEEDIAIENQGVLNGQSTLGDEIGGAVGDLPVAEPPLDSASTEPNPEMDGFGDFDTAEITTPQNTDVNVDEADESFRGFDAAPVSTEPPQVSLADDDASFGDFDAAPAPTSLPNIDEDKNDDFGDFDTAPPASETQPPLNNVDDDDFGDFDTAEPAQEPQASPQVEHDDGDDDDFGDFDTAQPTAQSHAADEDDDFGDFDTAASKIPDAGVGSDIVESPTPQESNSSDPLLQPVMAAMHRMFKFHAKEEDDDEVNNTVDTEKREMTVKELMTSMFSNEEKLENPDELPPFWETLKNSNLMLEGESQTIRKGSPPYRVHYPLEGFTGLYETKQLAPKGLAVSSSPVAESESRSVEPESSPAASRPSLSSAPDTNGTVVKLPPKKQQTEKPSRVDEFLEKIPDLSFMLSSELTLPAES